MKIYKITEASDGERHNICEGGAVMAEKLKRQIQGKMRKLREEIERG